MSSGRPLNLVRTGLIPSSFAAGICLVPPAANYPSTRASLQHALIKLL